MISKILSVLLETESKGFNIFTVKEEKMSLIKMEKFMSLYNYQSANVYQSFAHHIERIFEDVDVTGKKILEIGSGNGFLSLYLATHKSPQKVTVLDKAEGWGVDKNMLNINGLLFQFQDI